MHASVCGRLPFEHSTKAVAYVESIASRPKYIRRQSIEWNYVDWSASIDEGVCLLHNGNILSIWNSKCDDQNLISVILGYRVCRSDRMSARTFELIERYRRYAWRRYNLIVKNNSSSAFGPFIFKQPEKLLPTGNRSDYSWCVC